MKKILILITVIIFAMLVISGCGEKNIESKNMEQIYKEEGVPVKIETVKKRSFEKEIAYNTILSGIQESNASAMIGGRIEKVLVKVGDYVHKDQVLFTFPEDAPSTQFYQVKVALENSKNMYDRYKKLFDAGGISAQDLDNIKTQYEVNKANFQTARKMVKVLAPISGYVTKVNARESDDVKKETVLATIADLSKLKGTIQISEDEINDVKIGTKANATWQNITIEGTVTQVDMSMNPMTQAFGADVTFDNKNSKMKAGVTVDITLAGSQSNNKIVIERKNLVKKNGNYFVYVLDNGTAKIKKVSLGKSSGLYTEILSGLNEGDQLITEGQMNLEDNAKVNIIK